MHQSIRQKSRLPARVRRIRGQTTNPPNACNAKRAQGTSELIDALRAYIK